MEEVDVCGARKRDHATNVRISQVVQTVKLMATKGDPMGLGYKDNHEIREWGQEYRPNPLF